MRKYIDLVVEDHHLEQYEREERVQKTLQDIAHKINLDMATTLRPVSYSEDDGVASIRVYNEVSLEQLNALGMVSKKITLRPNPSEIDELIIDITIDPSDYDMKVI